MDRKAPEILDLDIFIPPRRVIRITERKTKGPLGRRIQAVLGFFGLKYPGDVREIDVSQVATGPVLQIEQLLACVSDLSEQAAKAEKGHGAEKATEFYRQIEGQMIEMLIVACRPSFPEISRAWIEQHATPDQILEWFRFIIKPFEERAERLMKDAAAKGIDLKNVMPLRGR